MAFRKSKMLNNTSIELPYHRIAFVGHVPGISVEVLMESYVEGDREAGKGPAERTRVRHQAKKKVERWEDVGDPDPETGEQLKEKVVDEIDLEEGVVGTDPESWAYNFLKKVDEWSDAEDVLEPGQSASV